MHLVKKCFKCLSLKPVNDFYRHSEMGDGYLGKCKECSRKDSKANRKKNIERYREYDRGRGNRQGSRYLKSYREKFPNKYKAHNKVNNALRDGRLFKPDNCESCFEKKKIVGHHDDYLKPLEVRWLCQACHKIWHAENGEGLNPV